MKVYHNSFYSMGTRLNVVFPSIDEALCNKLFYLMKKECERIEGLLSYFNPASVVTLINREACKSFVRLDDELFVIVQTCLEYSKLTYGAYDITLRPIIESIKSNNNFSSTSQSYLDKIEIDDSQKSIHFTNDNVKIDFGGFGKGYALEKIKTLLDNCSLENTFISFGESSITVKGKHPGGNNWPVGIKDFYNSKEPLHTFELSDCSISTSSNYYLDDTGQLCYKINVISPFNGKPIDEVSVVSVKSASPLQAEILSTAFLVMNDEKICETTKKIDNIEVVKTIYKNKEPIKKIYYGI